MAFRKSPASEDRDAIYKTSVQFLAHTKCSINAILIYYGCYSAVVNPIIILVSLSESGLRFETNPTSSQYCLSLEILSFLWSPPFSSRDTDSSMVRMTFWHEAMSFLSPPPIPPEQIASFEFCFGEWVRRFAEEEKESVSETRYSVLESRYRRWSGSGGATAKQDIPTPNPCPAGKCG